MDLLSSFVENLSFIIQKETENSLGSILCSNNNDVKDDVVHPVIIDPVATSDNFVHDSYTNTPEVECISEGVENLSNLNDLFSDLSACCQQVQELCTNDNFELSDRPLSLGCSVAVDDSNMLGIMSRVLQSLSLELDSGTFKKITNDKCIWSSIVLNDLQRAINLTSMDCSLTLDQKITPPSHIRLGRVFAWARDQSNRQTHGDTNDLNRVQKRLCRRLCNLVRLTHTEKRIARTHPFLISLRHELLRIRTRVTGRLLSEKTDAIGSTTLTGLSPGYDTRYLTGHSPVPNCLSTAFEKLIDQILDIFMKLPPHVPCLSLDELLEHDGLVHGVSSDRREKLRQLITRTILSFYNQFDVSWADAASEQQQLPFYVTDPDEVVSEDDEIDVVVGLRCLSDPDDHSVLFAPNPALVQTVLDRFDHHIRGSNRKRPMMPSSQSHDGEISISAVERTNTVEEVSGAKRIRLYSEEPCDPAYTPPPSNAALPKEVDNQNQSEGQDYVSASNEVATAEVPVATEAVTCDIFAIKPTTTTQEDQPRPSGVRRKPVSRSLRSRVTRTPPSDASYSEGEVVSSDDEEEVVDSESEPVPRRSIPVVRPATPPELILLLQQQQKSQQQKQVQGQQEIPQQESQHDQQKKPAYLEDILFTDSPVVDIDFEDNQPTQTTTPVASDIDLTELEIMDEWAPPGASCLVKNSEPEWTDQATQVESANKTVSKETRSLAAEEEAARVLLLATDRSLSDLVSQALSTCTSSLDSLIAGQVPVESDEAPLEEVPGESAVCRLSKETEAAIERTAASFKEHVTSILANLLHAIPSPLDINSFKLSDKLLQSRLSKRNQSQPVNVRNASRVRGMLRAYQQEAAKRLSSTKTAAPTTTE